MHIAAIAMSVLCVHTGERYDDNRYGLLEFISIVQIQILQCGVGRSCTYTKLLLKCTAGLVAEHFKNACAVPFKGTFKAEIVMHH